MKKKLFIAVAFLVFITACNRSRSPSSSELDTPVESTQTVATNVTVTPTMLSNGNVDQVSTAYPYPPKSSPPNPYPFDIYRETPGQDLPQNRVVTETPFPEYTDFGTCLFPPPDRKGIGAISISGISAAEIKPGMTKIPTSKDFEVYSLAYSPDGKFLAWGEGSSIYYWNIRENTVQNTLDSGFFTSSLAFSPSGGYLAAGGGAREANLIIWETKNFSKVIAIERGEMEGITSISFSLDEKIIAINHGYSSIELLDITTGQILRSFPDYSSSAFSFDGKSLALGANTHGRILVLSLENYQPMFELSEESFTRIDQVRFSQNGLYLVASDGGYLRIWDIEEKKLLHTFGNYSNWLLDFDISSDNKQIAFVGGNPIVMVCEIETGKLLNFTKGAARRVAFSPDVTKLAIAGGWNNPIRLWDLPNPSE